jgi:hypothetical protein
MDRKTPVNVLRIFPIDYEKNEQVAYLKKKKKHLANTVQAVLTKWSVGQMIFN